MRVAIVAGHFSPAVGYQEVYLARACARLGHAVRVVTSDRVSPSGRGVVAERYQAGSTRDESYGFEVLRLPARAQVGAMVVARGVRGAVEAFAPDVAIVLGVGKLFPNALFARGPRPHRLVVLFGDNSDFWDFSNASLGLRSLRMKLSQRTLKDAVYRRAVRSADRVGVYTAETQAIVASSLSRRPRAELERKCFRTTLGFDPDEFFFSPAERASARLGLGAAPDERVLITGTRVNPKKALERVIAAVSRLHAQGQVLHYVIAGFLGDEYERELKALIAAQPRPELFHPRPFLDHAGMRRLYCGGDLGVWLKAAISIQESMGTGLPVLLEDKPSVNHLVTPGENGWYFEGDALAAELERALGELEARPRPEVAAENAARLSYDVIAHAILDEAVP